METNRMSNYIFIFVHFIIHLNVYQWLAKVLFNLSLIFLLRLDQYFLGSNAYETTYSSKHLHCNKNSDGAMPRQTSSNFYQNLVLYTTGSMWKILSEPVKTTNSGGKASLFNSLLAQGV